MSTTNNVLSDHYAPNWLALYDANGALSANASAQVKCHICSIQYLAITHPSTPGTNDAGTSVVETGGNVEHDEQQVHTPAGNNEEYETFTVLPCGHAFGYACIKAWFEHAQMPNCPFCRKYMRHRGCGHVVEIQPRDTVDGFDFPLTVADLLRDHEELPLLCKRCISYGYESTSATFIQLRRDRRRIRRDGIIDNEVRRDGIS